MSRKLILLSLVALSVSVFAKPIESKIPEWLTDDKTKVWAVQNLIEVMANREFYKIDGIEVLRGHSVENNSETLRATIKFSDAQCPDRELDNEVIVPFCNANGCPVLTSLTDCIDRPATATKIMVR